MTAWVCGLLFVAASQAAESPVVSTAPAAAAAAAAPNPFELDLSYDQGGYRFKLDYRLRWDGTDIGKLPSTAHRWIFHPLDTLGGNALDIVAATRIGVYGLHVRPSRALVYGPPAAPPGSAAGRPRPVRLDVHPVVRDLRSDLYRGLRRAAIEGGMDLMLPGARGASFGQKEQIYQDLMDAQRGFREPRVYY